MILITLMAAAASHVADWTKHDRVDPMTDAVIATAALPDVGETAALVVGCDAGKISVTLSFTDVVGSGLKETTLRFDDHEAVTSDWVGSGRVMGLNETEIGPLLDRIEQAKRLRVGLTGLSGDLFADFRWRDAGSLARVRGACRLPSK